jgi:hypothetical protein
MLATHSLTHFLLVEICIGPIKFIWNPHDLVGAVFVLSFNQYKGVCWKMCVRESVPNTPHKKNQFYIVV